MLLDQQSFIYKQIIIIKKMSKKIRTVGFRNGLFTGQVHQEQKSNEIPDGIGIIVDDMYLTCLSTWSYHSSDSIKAQGPSVLFYPNREIFYSEQYPSNGRFVRFWCFLTSQLQVYGFGESGNLAFVQPGGNTISRINNKQNRVEHVEDYTYHNQEQKWRKIEEILGNKIDNNSKSIDRFIEINFSNSLNNKQGKYNFITARPKKSQTFYGIFSNNEGIGVSLKNQIEKVLVSSIGYYKQFEPANQISFGRKYYDQINSSSYKFEEGNFETQQLFAVDYTQDRPSESFKYSRNYFRQSTTFSNKFLHLNQAGIAYKKLKALQKQYILKIDSKYGQRIIQGQLKKQEPEQDILQPQKYESQKYKQASYANRQYNLQQAKAKIEQEINRKKAAGSPNYTGTFNLYALKSSTNNFGNTSSKKDAPLKTSTRRSIENSPIQNYKISYSQEMTNRNQRSPRSNTQKYNYTDYEEIEPIITGDWKKQSKTYFVQEKYRPSSPTKLVTRQARVPVKKVNQFTLYPVEIQRQYRELAQYQQAQRQKQAERQRQRQARIRNIEKQRILREIQYQVEKQKQRKLRQEKQNERERERILAENNYVPTKRIHNPQIHANLYQPPLHEVNIFPSPPPPPVTTYPTAHFFEPSSKRRFFQSYNYTEQPGHLKQKTPTKLGKVEPPKPSYSPSPVNRLRINTQTDLPIRQKVRQKRQISRSPIARPTNRKIYSYVDE